MHRVQRVPATESQGRIHTSAAGVLVTPEAEDVDVEINTNDLRIDVFRSSRPRRPVRQHHRLRGADHPPARPASWPPARTRRASSRTRSRRCASCAPGCWPPRRRRPTQEAADARRSQVRTVDRSERIRTYNFPENRISDHRVGFKAYNLDQVLDGDLDAMIQSSRGRRRGGRSSPRRRPASNSERGPRMNLLLAEVAQATQRLADAGVPSPRFDAEELAAHIHGVQARRAAHRQGRGLRRPLLGGHRPPRGRASRCSTSPAAPSSATSSSRSAPGCSCPARRPSRWSAGR